MYENRPHLLLGKLSCVLIPGHGCTRRKPEMGDSLDSSARCSAAPHKADAAGFCEIMQAIILHEMLSGRTKARVATEYVDTPLQYKNLRGQGTR